MDRFARGSQLNALWLGRTHPYAPDPLDLIWFWGAGFRLVVLDEMVVSWDVRLRDGCWTRGEGAERFPRKCRLQEFGDFFGGVW